MTDKTSDKISSMFDKIAPHYDFFNNLISFFTHKFVKISACKMLKVENGTKIIDLCTGTGDIAKILQKRGANVCGVDFSDAMLEIAEKKVKNADFIVANIMNLPQPASTFDAATAFFALRNVENINLALFEINRVLKCGGEFLYLDFNGKNPIFDFFTPILTHIFKGDIDAYKYLVQSKNEFLKKDELIKIFNLHRLELKREKSYFMGAITALLLEKR